VALDLILLNCVVRNYDGSIDQAPQLGLLYIATLAKSKGYEVRILAGDDLFSPLVESIGPSDSPLVGFYSNSDNYHEVLRLSQQLRGSLPHIRTIVGGPLANIRHQDLVAQHSIDFACSGDGEFLVLERISETRRAAVKSNSRINIQE
jgi:anaerobic magnesium-protoporphyrin IX monomethyl ester cyclase